MSHKGGEECSRKTWTYVIKRQRQLEESNMGIVSWLDLLTHILKGVFHNTGLYQINVVFIII